MRSRRQPQTCQAVGEAVPSPSPEHVLLLKLIHHTLKQIPGIGELESFSVDQIHHLLNQVHQPVNQTHTSGFDGLPVGLDASPIESNAPLIESETAAHLVNHLNITHITSLEWLSHQYVLTDDMLKLL